MNRLAAVNEHFSQEK